MAADVIKNAAHVARRHVIALGQESGCPRHFAESQRPARADAQGQERVLPGRLHQAGDIVVDPAVYVQIVYGFLDCQKLLSGQDGLHFIQRVAAGPFAQQFDLAFQ